MIVFSLWTGKVFLRLETPVPRLEILVFSVWKLEFLSVETEVYNCGNAKELIAFYQTVIRVLLQVADTFLFFNSIVGILFMAVFRGKRISTKGDLNNKTAFV